MGNKKSISNYVILYIWDFPPEFTQIWGQVNSDMDFAEAMSDSLSIERDTGYLLSVLDLLSNYETTLQKLVEVVSAPPPPTPRQEDRPGGGMCFGPVVAMGMVSLALGMTRTARRS